MYPLALILLDVTLTNILLFDISVDELILLDVTSVNILFTEVSVLKLAKDALT